MFLESCLPCFFALFYFQQIQRGRQKALDCRIKHNIWVLVANTSARHLPTLRDLPDAIPDFCRVTVLRLYPVHRHVVVLYVDKSFARTFFVIFVPSFQQIPCPFFCSSL